MVAGLGRRDPFWDDGRGARRRHLVKRIQGDVAFSMAIVACGLTAAMWLRELLPVVGIRL
jgi:hypothetical protein